MKQLRLVESFAELRQGMVVVDIACACGSSSHEQVLTELWEFVARDNVPCEPGVAWEAEPDCDPDRTPDYFNGVDAMCVAQHRIFEVVESQPAAARVREKEKVRR